MVEEVSEANARAWYARGLTTQLIEKAIEETPSPTIVDKAFTEKTGRNITAIGRVASRIRRHPGCVYARPYQIGKNLGLQIVVRRAGRDTVMKYVDRENEFTQDMVRYVLRDMAMNNRGIEDAVVGCSRHAIQRWIERGGAGDPRLDLVKKLDHAVLSAIFCAGVFDAAAVILAKNVKDRNGRSARFGVPDSRGGLWIAGVSGLRTALIESYKARGVRFRCVASFLTYIGPEQVSASQAAYRELALTEGLPMAIQGFPDEFLPAGGY